MKKICVCIIAGVVFVGCLFQANQSGAEETVRVAWGEWKPYCSEELPHKGFYTHLFSEIFAAVGMKVEHVIVPWKRAYIITQDGDADTSPGWMKTPEREAEVLFSEPYAEACVYYFHRKETTFDWATEEDLAGWTFGATLGYSQEAALKALQEKGVKLKLDTSAEDLFNMKKLVAGRIDLFASNRAVAETLLREHFTPEETATITFHEKPMYCDAHYAIFSKTSEKSKPLLTSFNEGLKKLKESGRYDEILEAFRNGAYEKP
ncbi:MAG: transporter substrate-binding domain-containing protein [bacterium]|nr:transporter substrate-binding domain-containing protein [bacterium]